MDWIAFGTWFAVAYCAAFAFVGAALALRKYRRAAPLTVAAAGTLRIGAGASIAFADSSSAEWTLPVGAHLVIDADMSVDSVRFGTNANGLSKAQLARIRTLDGAHVRLNANGYLRCMGFSLAIR